VRVNQSNKAWQWPLPDLFKVYAAGAPRGGGDSAHRFHEARLMARWPSIRHDFGLEKTSSKCLKGSS
jgi:hypothetical protein